MSIIGKDPKFEDLLAREWEDPKIQDEFQKDFERYRHYRWADKKSLIDYQLPQGVWLNEVLGGVKKHHSESEAVKQFATAVRSSQAGKGKRGRIGGLKAALRDILIATPNQTDDDALTALEKYSTDAFWIQAIEDGFVKYWDQHEREPIQIGTVKKYISEIKKSLR